MNSYIFVVFLYTLIFLNSNTTRHTYIYSCACVYILYTHIFYIKNFKKSNILTSYNIKNVINICTSEVLHYFQNDRVVRIPFCNY